MSPSKDRFLSSVLKKPISTKNVNFPENRTIFGFLTITFFSDHLDQKHFRNRSGCIQNKLFWGSLNEKKANFGQKCQYLRKKSKFFVFRPLFFQWPVRVLNFFAYFRLFKRKLVYLRLFEHTRSNQTYSKHVFIPN